MHVYKQTEKGLWTVGFYDPSGKWHSESDHDSPDKAAERVAYLNGSKINNYITNKKNTNEKKTQN